MSNPEFDRNMTRECKFGGVNLFVNQTFSGRSILPPDIRAQAFASIGNTVQFPVINYDGDVTVANSRSCVIADNENTSALYTVVWATYAVGFTMVPAMYMNNEITYEHDWRRKMEKIIRAFLTSLDKSAIAALEANKTQVFNELLYYTQSGNSVKVPWDMRTEILGDINPLMTANCFDEQMHIVGNVGVDSIVRKLAQLGLYNEVNKRLEYDDKVFHISNNLPNESGVFGTGYAVADGNVGLLTRVDREALRRASANGHEWDVVRLPGLDLEVGSHYYTAVGDQSATAGDATADMTCAIKEYFGFSLDVAFVVAYNSDPSEVANPIMKFEIAKSDAANPVARPVTIVNGEGNPVITKAVTAGA